MSLQDTFLKAADLAKEAGEIKAREDERGRELSARIAKLREDADKESAADRRRRAEIEGDIAKLVGPAMGNGQRPRRRRSHRSGAAVQPANADAVLAQLKKVGKANAKAIADALGDDVTTASVAAALSVLKDEGKAQGVQGSRGRYRNYEPV